MKKTRWRILLFAMALVASFVLAGCLNPSSPSGSSNSSDDNAGTSNPGTSNPGNSTPGTSNPGNPKTGGTIRITNNNSTPMTFEVVFNPGSYESLEWRAGIEAWTTRDINVSRDGLYGVYIIVDGLRYGSTQTISGGITQTFIFRPW